MRSFISISILFMIVCGSVHAVAQPCHLSFLKVQLSNQLENAKSVYQFKRSLGAGYMSEVSLGVLPEGFEKNLAGSPNSWKAGDLVAVKVPKAGVFRQTAIFHEAQMLEKIASHDPENLFVRGAWDKDRNSLIAEYALNTQSLKDWMDSWAMTIPREKIDFIKRQLKLALKELNAAGIVHSDLNPSNILINSETLQIKIIDFGVAALEGGNRLPFWTERQIERRSRDKYLSPGTRTQKPARFEDDAYSVNVVVSELEGGS